MQEMQYQKNPTGQTEVFFSKEFYRGEFRCDFFVSSLMKRCWAAQIETLAEIDRICRKYDISYFADSGTLLGAVRHKGFIPWDDDVDIVMLRKDYNRFLFYAEKEIGRDYQLYKQHEDKKFDDVFARVVNDKGLQNRSDLSWCHGCFVYAGVDIFPLDYLPRDKNEEKLLLYLTTLVERVREALRTDSIEDYNKMLKVLSEIERICQIQFDRNGDLNKQLGDVFEEICQWYSEEEADEITLFPYIATNPKYRLKKEWYAEAVLLDFESLRIPCPIGYEKILTTAYGDYQKWEKFTSLHNYPYYKNQLKIREEKFCNNLHTLIAESLENFFGVKESRIRKLEVLKLGFRNYTFKFKIGKVFFVIRVAEGSEAHLMDRNIEKEIYNTLKPYDVTDELYFYSVSNGNKISLYLENTRPCDVRDYKDVVLCMEVLSYIHHLDIKVDGSFDLLERLEEYERRWEDYSYFSDYEETKEKICRLCTFVDKQEKHIGLTHFDITADDFLIKEEVGKTDIRVIDWEYAGMQDTDIDLAMFALRAEYSVGELDELIEIYFGEKGCSWERRMKIYAYMGICALFFSNYYEYYDRKGKEMNEVTLKFYEIAKEYYDKVAMSERRVL